MLANPGAKHGIGSSLELLEAQARRSIARGGSTLTSFRLYNRNERVSGETRDVLLTVTALAGEVLHVRLAADPTIPWLGQAPLRRASLTAGMLQAIESALAEVFDHAPLGSQIIPYPESPEVDLENLGRGFRGRRGRVLLRESVNVSAAGGPVPPSSRRRRGWRLAGRAACARVGGDHSVQSPA